MNRTRSLVIRILGLLVIFAIGGMLLAYPIQEKREDRRVRAMLLEVQEALQNYHVDEELYPRRMMTGAELIAFLSEAGFLKGEQSNPWTGEGYVKGTEDWLRYRTDSIAESYELIVYEPNTETVKFRLDSTENQSLE